ncbi:MAG: hypothetical protein Q9178_004367 [Gyalolechia marmorata]
MRLRLTVQRHGLPPARVLWTIAAVRPPFSAAGPEPTIAQLLEQINEIIPLESEDWGLEDYAVEVRGFECLHFSETNQVLKEDDEVWYGRYQISNDGKHLTDGVAFGRPLLRRPDRPAVRIPPRKRRRLTYDEDDEEDFEAHSQLVMHTDLSNEVSSQSGSDDTEDAASASDDEEDLDAELNDIRNDFDPSILEDEEAHILNRPSAPTVGGDSEQLGTLSRRRPRKARGLGLIASSFLVDENGTPYPETYDNPLLDMFADDEPVGRAASPERTEPGESVPESRRYRRDRPETKYTTQSGASTRPPRRNGRNARDRKPEPETPATVRLESSDDSGDDDFELSDDSGIAEDDSDKENATPGSQASTEVDEAAELAAKIDSSFSYGSDSDADDTSSSGSSTSESTSSDSEGEQASRTRSRHAAGDQETSCSGSSSSNITSSSSEDEQPPRQLSSSKQAVNAPTREETTTIVPTDAHDEPPELREPVPPGAGQRRTKLRNQRRRDRVRLLRLQQAGELPPNATTADLHKFEANAVGQPSEDASDQAFVSNQNDAQVESKRQALLQAFDLHGVNIENNPASNQASTVAEGHSRKPSPGSLAANRSSALIASIEKSTPRSSERTYVEVWSASQPGGKARDEQEEPTVSDLQASQGDSQTQGMTSQNQLVDEDVSGAAKPRMRLDMGSSRRLLFGALGHRAPKTKEDEVRLQEKMMKDAQTPKKPPPQLAEDDNVPRARSSLLPDGNIRWEDKIELSAVECCHDGVELSTPPFPFVQRWDPQQQRGYSVGEMAFAQKSRKRKRNNKNYEASFEPLGDDAAPNQGLQVSYNFNDHTTNTNEEQVPLTRNPSDENLKAANDQLLRETKETYGDIHEKPDPFHGLSQILDDLSARPSLDQAACSAGTIIAFKQLDMSAETKWQPRISDYRTALINSVLDDGTLSMTMAPRDQSRAGKQYDPDTGERLYTKFEMPGYNEDENDDNSDLLELAFADLIEPKLVRTSEKEPEMDKLSSGASLHVDGGVDESDQHVTMDHQVTVPSDNSVQPVLQNLRDPQKDAEVTEQFHKEIQDLFKDAGWRSSIQSNESIRPEDPDASRVDQDQDHEMNETQPDSEAPHSTHDDRPSSPHFHGFSSSPPAQPYQEVEDPVVYPNLRGASSGPYDEATDDPNRTLAETSSQADMEAMQAIRDDFEKELNQPATPKDYNHHLQSSRGSGSPSNESKEAEHKNTSPPADPYSLCNTIPDSQPPPQSITTTFTSSLPYNHRSKTHSDKDDDDDLPDLNTVVTSFQSQQSTTIKSEHHSSSSDEAFMSTLPSHKSRKSSTSKPTTNKKTNNNNNNPPNSSAPARSSNIIHHHHHHHPHENNPKKSHGTLSMINNNNNDNNSSSSSHDWRIGTQVVDLTLSSDPIDFSMEENVIVSVPSLHDDDGDEEVVDDDGDGSSAGSNASSLPKGEGWVRKNNGLGLDKKDKKRKMMMMGRERC